MDYHPYSECLTAGADDKKEWIREGIATATKQVQEAGYNVDSLNFQTGEGLEVLEAKLKGGKWDGIIVGKLMQIAL
jgi:hypothetical protein